MGYTGKFKRIFIIGSTFNSKNLRVTEKEREPKIIARNKFLNKILDCNKYHSEMFIDNTRVEIKFNFRKITQMLRNEVEEIR